MAIPTIADVIAFAAERVVQGRAHPDRRSTLRTPVPVFKQSSTTDIRSGFCSMNVFISSISVTVCLVLRLMILEVGTEYKRVIWSCCRKSLPVISIASGRLAERILTYPHLGKRVWEVENASIYCGESPADSMLCASPIICLEPFGSRFSD